MTSRIVPTPVVERAAALDPEVLRHRDLDALDVVAVPEGLQEGVHEAEEEHVDDRPLPEVVVDAEDRRLRKLRARGCGSAPAPKRGRCRRASRRRRGRPSRSPRPELLDDPSEQHGRNGEVVRRPLRGAELLPDRPERGDVVVVAVDVAQQSAKLRERGGVEPAMLLQAVPGPGLHLVEAPAGLGHADHRHSRGCRASASPAATGRSSCRPDRPWRRRRPARRLGRGSS